MGLFGLFGKKKPKQNYLDPVDIEIDLSEALDAYNAGDFSDALEIFLKLAEYGNAEAQYYCGRIYCRQDLFEDADQEKGLYWYKKAAEQGDRRAKEFLDSLAVESAAQKEHEDETLLIKKGLDAFDREDFDAAIACLEPLAEKGSLHAQFFCGLAHDEKSRNWAGHLLDESYDREGEWEKALHWYEKVINSNNEKWKGKLLQIMTDRMQSEESLRNDEAHVPEKVLFLLGKQGNAQALFQLGRLYEYHILNFSRAYQCYEIAARQGDVHSQLKCGEHYYKHGSASGEEIKKALYWYHKAAEAKNPMGCYYCGLMLYNGEGTEADKETAKRLIEWSASQSFTPAKRFLRDHTF